MKQALFTANTARLFTILLAAGAVLALVWGVITEIDSAFGRGGFSLLELLDEMEDELEIFLLLGAGAVLCAFSTKVLRKKAQIQADEDE